MICRRKNLISATFLLLVFSLNTIAGFACSIGLDLGYNASHHKHANKLRGFCNNCHKHEHFLVESNAYTTTFSQPDDDCCSNQVNSFARLDKSLVHNQLLIKSPAPDLTPDSRFPPTENARINTSVKSWSRFLRRSRSLDHTDVRISIQSFQV